MNNLLKHLRIIGSLICFMLVGCSSQAGKYVFVMSTYPEGTRQPGVFPERDIYIVNLNGSELTQLTADNGTDSAPTLSPDGTKIAFVSRRDDGTGGADNLFIMNLDGSNIVKVNQESLPGTVSDIAWSPNGNKLAFSASFGNWSIYSINTDGTDLVKLTGDRVHALWPAWSPDGTQIAFASSPTSEGRQQLYIMDSDGSNPTRLIEIEGGIDAPAWSPDGTLIAFTSYYYGDGEVALIKPDGSELKYVTNEPSDDSEPIWTADSKQIIFVARSESEAKVYRINIDGSNLKMLFDIAAFSP